MKRRRLSILAVVGMLAPGHRAKCGLRLLPQPAFVETFDDASGLATNTGFFSDDVGDYFGLTDGLTGDFGAGAVPSALKPYTGFDGSFMTGMDQDGY